MSLWSLSPPRVTMGEPNRGRFSSTEPKPDTTLGPAHYSPKRCDLHNSATGNVALRPVLGKTEREVTLSNGVNVRHVSPIGPGAYQVQESWQRLHTPGSPSPARSRSVSPSGRPGTCSPVRDMKSTLRTSSGALGPGEYGVPPDPQRPVARGVAFSKTPRAVCAQLDKPKPLSIQELHALSPQSPNKSLTPARKQRPVSQTLTKRGSTISKTPRCFNLSNPNSFTFAHRDDRALVPPPGWYEVSVKATPRKPVGLPSPSRGAGTFSTSPRRIQLAYKTSAPGPGTYNPGGNDIVKHEFVM